MASIPPIINTSQPGIPAGSNNSIPSNVPDPDLSATIGTSDIYPYNSVSSLGTSYKNYLFSNMYKEQNGKNQNKLLRFSLACKGLKFQAHLDPSHITDEQGKRIVQLDTLTGIVLQDYGYTARRIEIRGTTGAAYYVEIKRLDDLFNNQSTSGQPTPATLTLESRTYTGVWKEFSFERMAQENTYKYIIGFVVMNVGKLSGNDNAINFSSSVTQSNTIQNASSSSTGQNLVQYIPYAGNSPNDYVTSIPQSITIPQRQQALNYINAHWSDASDFNKRSYPGDRANLLQNEVLVVPLDWSTILQ